MQDLSELKNQRRASQDQPSSGGREKQCKHNVRGGCWLCKDAIKELIEQGMAPEIARAEVLEEEKL